VNPLGRAWEALPATVRSVATVASGDGVSKLLAFVGTAVIVGLASPEQMGTITIFITLQTILLQLTDLGLGVALVKHTAGSARPPGFERTVLTARALLVAAVGLPALLAGPWLAAHAVGRPIFAEPLRYAALAIVGGGLMAFATSYLQARRRFLALSLVRIGEGASRLGLLLALVVVLGFSVPGVLWIQVLAPLAVGLVGVALVPRGALARGGGRTELRELFDLSRWILAATIVHMFAFQLDTLLLGAFSTPAEVGSYGAALRLSSPLVMLAGVLGTVFLPEAMRHRETAGARRFFLRSLRLTVPLGILGLAAALACGLLLPRLFPQYARLLPVFALLSAGLASYAMVAAGQGVLYALDRTALVAGVAAGQFLVNLAGNLLLVPRFGALGAAVTTGSAWVLSALAYATLVLWLTRPAGPPPAGAQAA
jgi:O-antigen/teichoic acid export membrane protein